MNADDFAPVLWSKRGVDVAWLADGRRFFRGKIIDKETTDYIMWPVIIRLCPCFAVEWRVEIRDGVDATFGKLNVPASVRPDWPWPFLRRSAQTALAEVWRTVGKLEAEWGHKHKLTYSPLRLTEYKRASILWKTVAALHWDGWNRAELSMDARARTLAKWLKVDCTTKALRRFAEERGI